MNGVAASLLRATAHVGSRGHIHIDTRHICECNVRASQCTLAGVATEQVDVFAARTTRAAFAVEEDHAVVGTPVNRQTIALTSHACDGAMGGRRIRVTSRRDVEGRHIRVCVMPSAGGDTV